jgi:hypothetical protein
MPIGQVLTGLPVHVNAGVELSPNRNSIHTRQGGGGFSKGGVDEVRCVWNEQLIQVVAARAYAETIIELSSKSISEWSELRYQYYQLWLPDSNSQHLFANMQKTFYEHLTQQALRRRASILHKDGALGNAGGTTDWCSIAEAVYGCVDELRPKQIVDMFRVLSEKKMLSTMAVLTPRRLLVECPGCPKFIYDNLEQYGLAIITPDWARECSKLNCMPVGPDRQDCGIMLRYCMQGCEDDLDKLVGVPLVPLQDGSVGTFLQDGSGVRYFVVDGSLQGNHGHVFEKMKQSLIDLSSISNLKIDWSSASTTADALTHFAAESKFNLASLNCERLSQFRHVFLDGLNRGDAFLDDFWMYLDDVCRPVTDLEHFTGWPLVSANTQDGPKIRPLEVTHANIHVGDFPSQFKDVLMELGCSVLTPAMSELLKKVRHLKLSAYVYQANPEGVLLCIHAAVGQRAAEAFGALRGEHRQVLFDYFSSEISLAYFSSEISPAKTLAIATLKSLPIFLLAGTAEYASLDGGQPRFILKNDETTELFAACDGFAFFSQHTFAQGMLASPRDPKGLDIPRNFMTKGLKIEELDIASFLNRHVFKGQLEWGHRSAPPVREKRDSLLVFIVSNLDLLRRSAEFGALEEVLRSVPCIPCTDVATRPGPKLKQGILKEYKMPRELYICLKSMYSPASPSPNGLAGLFENDKQARFPWFDFLNLKQGEYEHYLSGVEKLGAKKHLSCQCVRERVQSVMKLPLDKQAQRSKLLLGYLQFPGTLESLEAEATFKETISELCSVEWLPTKTMRDPVTVKLAAAKSGVALRQHEHLVGSEMPLLDHSLAPTDYLASRLGLSSSDCDGKNPPWEMTSRHLCSISKACLKKPKLDEAQKRSVREIYAHLEKLSEHNEGLRPAIKSELDKFAWIYLGGGSFGSCCRGIQGFARFAGKGSFPLQEALQRAVGLISLLDIPEGDRPPWGLLNKYCLQDEKPVDKSSDFHDEAYLAVLKHLSDKKRALTVDEVLATIQIVMHVIERADVGTVVDQLLMPTDKNHLSRFLVIDDTFGRRKVPVQWMNETDLGIIVKSDSEYGVCSSEEQQRFKKLPREKLNRKFTAEHLKKIHTQVPSIPLLSDLIAAGHTEEFPFAGQQ